MKTNMVTKANKEIKAKINYLSKRGYNPQRLRVTNLIELRRLYSYAKLGIKVK
jgi:hypothetical protein